MVTVNFTRNLRRFFGDLPNVQIEATSVAQLLHALEAQHPGIRGYLVEDDDSLRKHVNVFVNGDMIADRARLSDPLPNGCEVHVIQALSGG